MSELLRKMDIDRGCTPSPAWLDVVYSVGLALPGAAGEVGFPGSGEARSMSVNGLSL